MYQFSSPFLPKCTGLFPPKDRSTKEKLTVNENESVKNADNVEGALAVDELDKDEIILSEDLLHSEVLDMFISHENLSPPDVGSLNS